MIILRGGPGADGPRPPLKLPSQPPYNGVSRDLRPRLTKERAEAGIGATRRVAFRGYHAKPQGQQEYQGLIQINSWFFLASCG